MDKRPFAVYRTVKVDLESIVDRLGRGITGTEKHALFWHQTSDNFLEASPMTVIRHHVTTEGDCNQNFIVIADRSDVQSHGLLVINLNFSRRIDALREKTYKVGDLVPSWDIGHIPWIESLSKAENPLFPRKLIAFFAPPEPYLRKHMREIHNAINGGLGGRKESMGSILAEWEGAETGNSDDIVKQWRRESREKDWWDGGFVLVTEKSWSKGEVLIVAQDPETGDVRVTNVQAQAAGEILAWLYIGLIRVKEAWSDSIVKELLNPIEP